MRSKLILATRGSPLALAQALLVKNGLEKAWPGLEVEVLKLKTSGDLILDRPLRTVGGKGLFVKEIEEALLEGKADIEAEAVLAARPALRRAHDPISAARDGHVAVLLPHPA